MQGMAYFELGRYPEAKQAFTAAMRTADAREAASRSKNMVLLGDPGSGKSTFVKQLASEAAKALLAADPAAPPPKMRLPQKNRATDAAAALLVRHALALVPHRHVVGARGGHLGKIEVVDVRAVVVLLGPYHFGLIGGHGQAGGEEQEAVSHCLETIKH